MSLEMFLLLQPFGKFKEDGYTLLFVCLVEFACEAIWTWTFFFVGRFFFLIFNFLKMIFIFSIYKLES